LLLVGPPGRVVLAVAAVRPGVEREGRPELPGPAERPDAGGPVPPGDGLPGVRPGAGPDATDSQAPVRHDAADPALATRHAPGAPGRGEAGAAGGKPRPAAAVHPRRALGIEEVSGRRGQCLLPFRGRELRFKNTVGVAQLVRASDCGSESR